MARRLPGKFYFLFGHAFFFVLLIETGDRFDFQKHAFNTQISFPYKESRGEKNVGFNSVLSLAGLPASGVSRTFGFWLVNRPVVVKGLRLFCEQFFIFHASIVM